MKKTLLVAWALLAVISFKGSSVSAASAKASATSRQAIVLLTSLDPSTLPKIFYLHGFYDHYAQVLENDFRKYYRGSSYELIVKHNADRWDVYNTLHDSNNVAVFWVSHAAPITANVNAGIGFDPLLVDYQNDDVKPLLKSIHPNLRWLSIVACNSQLILDWLKQNPQTDPRTQDPSLDIQGFNYFVDARKGLRSAVHESWNELNKQEVVSGYQAPCSEVRGHSIQIQREMSATAVKTGLKEFRAVSFMMNGKLIGVLPKTLVPAGTTGSTVTNFNIEMSDTLQSRAEMKITVDSGADPAQVLPDFDMGKFRMISDAGTGDWKVFADGNGVPFGVTRNLYEYTGPLQLAAESMTFKPFSCDSMPARE